MHDGRLDPGVELITKPFTRTALSSKLRDILDASEAPKRILLVEDEPLIQMLAAEFLEEAGFKVDTAATATQAMNKLNLTSVSLAAVIVDIGLPDRSGDVLVREIRSLHSALPIIVATGKGGDDSRSAFQNEEHLVIVGKPYVADDLYRALNKLGITTKAYRSG